MARRVGDEVRRRGRAGETPYDARVPLIAELLSRRVSRDGASPLLTYYDPSHGERTELSATTFANWVAKTSNLLIDELLVDPGDFVELELARTHPGHWVTLVWEMACWQTGTVVSVGRGEAVRVVVCGPGWSEVDPGPADLVACALHPLGLGFPDALSRSVIDYALEVRGQGDVYSGSPVAAIADAWRDADRSLSQVELVSAAPGAGRRSLTLPTTPWATASAALVRPLTTGGSVVVVAGAVDRDQLTRIRTDERVDATE